MKFLFDVIPDTIPPYDRVDKSYRVFNIPHYIAVHNEGKLVVDMVIYTQHEKLPEYVSDARIAAICKVTTWSRLQHIIEANIPRSIRNLESKREGGLFS